MSITDAEKAFAQKNAKTVYGLIGIVLTLQIIFISTRLYARYRLRGCFGTDDYLMGVASLSVIAVSIMGLLGPRWGAGHHNDTFQLEWLDPFSRVSNCILVCCSY